MGHKKLLRKWTSEGASSTIGIVMMVAITVGIMSLIFSWGGSLIDTSTSQTEATAVIEQFEVLKERAQSLIRQGIGAAQDLFVTINGGQLSIREDADRFVVTYTTEPGYDFNVSDIDDTDKTFELSILAGSIDRAVVHWITSDTSAPGNWWDEAWEYRKPVTITGSGRAVDDYQIALTIAHLTGKMNVDFSDLRFTDALGNELNYWIESYTPSTTADVWVKVPSILGTGTTVIYLYYGNAGAESVSDARATMYIYENMETAPTGTLIGDASYDAANDWVVLTEDLTNDNGQLQYTNIPESGFIANWRHYADNGNGGEATYFYTGASSTPVNEDASVNGYIFTADERQNELQINFNGGGGNIADILQFGIDNGNWHNVHIEYYEDGGSYYFQYWYDGAKRIQTSAGSTPGGDLLGWGARTSSYVNDHYIDDLIVRAYTFPEPSASLGSEEGGAGEQLSQWQYKRPITITGVGTALDTFQLNFVVDYVTDKMNSDFSDLRFTDASDTQSLNYWVEKYTAGVSANVWVTVPFIAATGNTTINMYYGNVGAESRSNGANTFIFFDGFSGGSVDLNKWGIAGAPAANAGSLELEAGEGIRSLSTTLGDRQVLEASAKQATSIFAGNQRGKTGAIAEASKYTDDIGASDVGFDIRYWGNDYFYENAGAETGRGAYTEDYLRKTMEYISATSVDFYLEGADHVQYTSGIPDESAGLSIELWNGQGDIYYVDWVLVRKYTPSMPTVTLGTEAQHSWLDTFENTNGISASDNVVIGGGSVSISGSASNNYHAESAGISTTTSETFIEKTSLTFTPTEVEDYLVIITGLAASNPGGAQTEVRIILDGDVISVNQVDNQVDAWDEYYYSFASHELRTFNASMHTVTVEFRSTNASYTAKIQNTHIMALKAGTAYTAAAENETTTNATTYVEKVNLTFAPSGAGAYLIIATADITENSTDYVTGVRLTHNGADQGSMAREPATALQTYTYATMRVTTLDTSTHVFAIEYASEDAGHDAHIANARITVVSLEEIGDYEYAESESESDTKNLNYVDKTVLTFTPAEAGDYLIVASAMVRGNYIPLPPGHMPVDVMLQIDGGNHGEMVHFPKDSSDYAPFFTLSHVTLDASQHTIKIRYRSNMILTDAYIKNARIVAIPLAGTSYEATGNITSTAIAPDFFKEWDVFYANDSAPAGTDITYKILDSSDDSVLATVSSVQANGGYNLRSETFGITSIKISAELTTTRITETPVLFDWGVSWKVSNVTVATGFEVAIVGNPQTITLPLDIEDVLYIDLYDGATLVGKICVFDIGALTYVNPMHTSVSDYTIWSESDAIISYPRDNSNGYMRTEPGSTPRGDDVYLKFTDTEHNTAEGAVSGSGGGTYVLSAEYEQTLVFYADDAAMLKVHAYGENSEVWIDYFMRNYNFTREGAVVTYQPGTFDIMVSLHTVSMAIIDTR